MRVFKLRVWIFMLSLLPNAGASLIFQLTGSDIVQLRAKQTAPLVNKHYQNKVTLTGQNPPLKCCQPLESLARLTITDLDLSMIEIWGL